jgi:hypothetical protein
MESAKRPGGLKGFFRTTGAFMYTTSVFLRERGFDALKIGYAYGGQAAFSIATVSMIVLMPLLFEIAREGQVCCICMDWE